MVPFPGLETSIRSIKWLAHMPPSSQPYLYSVLEILLFHSRTGLFIGLMTTIYSVPRRGIVVGINSGKEQSYGGIENTFTGHQLLHSQGKRISLTFVLWRLRPLQIKLQILPLCQYKQRDLLKALPTAGQPAKVQKSKHQPHPDIGAIEVSL